MKTSSSELKRRARICLSGKYGICVGATLLVYAALFVIMFFMILAMAAGQIFILSGSDYPGSYEGSSDIVIVVAFLVFYLLVLIVFTFLSTGMVKMYMNICTGKPCSLKDLLYAFANKPLRFLGLYVSILLITMCAVIPYMVVLIVSIVTDYIPVMAVLSVVMYLVALVGEMVIYLNLSQAMFLLLENPERTVFQCLKESRAMMKGNKGRLFYLSVSFAGMIVLGYCSLCIGLLWIVPYMSCTMIQFHLDLKQQGAGTEFEEIPPSAYREYSDNQDYGQYQ